MSDTLVVLAEPFLHACSRYHQMLSEEQLADLHALLIRHGFTADVTYRIEYDVIDLPLLRIFTYVLNSDGEVHLDESGDIVTQVTQVPLAGELPEWWKP